MKYETIIETDEFEDFEFYEDGNGKYIHGIDAGSVNGEWIALYFTECKQEPILDKIEPKCDRINSLASVLPYTAHREIQELLCEIMDLLKESEVNE